MWRTLTARFRFSPPSIVNIHVFRNSKLKEIDKRALDRCIQHSNVYILVRIAHCRMPLKQIEIVVQVNSDFEHNGNRKYDGETSEGVACSFAYYSSAV